jgi:hypothetical protein
MKQWQMYSDNNDYVGRMTRRFRIRSILVGTLLTASTLAPTIFAQDVARPVDDSVVVGGDGLVRIDTLRSLSQLAFGTGEVLKFDINYGFVTAGEAIMKVADTVYNGRPCFRIEFLVNSKPFFDWIYKVEDRYLTIVDSAGLFPWRFEQHIREGGYRRDFIAEFDQRQHVATTTEGRYVIPPYVQDMMSAFYFARLIDYSGYRPGQKLHLQNFYKDSTYSLDVKFKGRQTIEVEAGEFRCIILEPLASEGGLFKSSGSVLIWLTDDERKMPVRVNTKIPIGSIDSELIEYRGLKGELKAKIGE